LDIIVILPQSFVNEICIGLVRNWLTYTELCIDFRSDFVDAFLTQFNEYLTEGTEDNIKYYTLGETEEDGYLLAAEILEANQNRIALKN
jgi:hypothetical protein